MKLELMIPFAADQAIENMGDALCGLAESFWDKEDATAELEARRAYSYAAHCAIHAAEALEKLTQALETLAALDTAPAPKAKAKK